MAQRCGSCPAELCGALRSSAEYCGILRSYREQIMGRRPHQPQAHKQPPKSLSQPHRDILPSSSSATALVSSQYHSLPPPPSQAQSKSRTCFGWLVCWLVGWLVGVPSLVGKTLSMVAAGGCQTTASAKGPIPALSAYCPGTVISHRYIHT